MLANIHVFTSRSSSCNDIFETKIVCSCLAAPGQAHLVSANDCSSVVTRPDRRREDIEIRIQWYAGIRNSNGVIDFDTRRDIERFGRCWVSLPFLTRSAWNCNWSSYLCNKTTHRVWCFQQEEVGSQTCFKAFCCIIWKRFWFGIVYADHRRPVSTSFAHPFNWNDQRHAVTRFTKGTRKYTRPCWGWTCMAEHVCRWPDISDKTSRRRTRSKCCPSLFWFGLVDCCFLWSIRSCEDPAAGESWH